MTQTNRLSTASNSLILAARARRAVWHAAGRAVETLEARRLLAGHGGAEGSLLERLEQGHEHDQAHVEMPLAAGLPEQVAHVVTSRSDEGIFKDRNGGEFFFDAAPVEFVGTGDPLPVDGGLGGGDPSGGGGFQLSVPAFSSNPSATQKVFLDFDGHVVSGTLWDQNFNGGNPIHAQPYSTDDDIFNFSTTEISNIEEIWRRVSEDFAPFNVDVTTVDPGVSAFTAGAQALRVMISTDVDSAAMGGTGNPWFANAGGVAYLGSWRWTSDTPVWVFENKLGNGNPKYVTEAASHEVGHSFDLVHDGNSSTGYYGGHGTGPTGWAPIMGVGYNKPLSQWSKGEYADANNTEDDLAIITKTSNQVVYRSDAVGNSIATASNLAFTTTTNAGVTIRQFDGAGIIETRGDADVYKLDLTQSNGRLTMLVAPSYFLAGYSNLDIEAKLYRANGSLVQSVNPADDVDAFFDLELSAGTYYVAVDGVGKGDPLGTGYTDYGSLGQYDIVADYEYGQTTNAFQEINGKAEFEAEQFTAQAGGTGIAANSTWTQYGDTGAQGGLALLASPNVGVNTKEEIIGPRRDYAVNFTNTGTYYVWVRMRATSGSDKSIHVGMNGTATSLGSLGLQQLDSAWKWSNTMKSGQRVTVNVTSQGVQTLNIWMREDGTRIDAVILSKDPNFDPTGGGGGGGGGINEVNGRAEFEAETFTGQAGGTGIAANSTWNELIDGAANGGRALVASPNVGVNTKDLIIGPRRDYAINFTNTGTYYVWARMKGPGGSDKSFHVGLDGVATSLGSQGLQDQSGQWVWSNTMKTGQRITVNVTAAGTRTFNMWMREDGVQVDAFLLTKDAAFNPNNGGGGGGAGTVNFETLAVGNLGTGIYNDPAGYSFSSLPGTGTGTTPENLWIYGAGNGYASKVLHPQNFGRKIVVQPTAGGTFGLEKFDYASGLWADAGDATVTGFFSNGTTQTRTYSFTNRTLTSLTLNWLNLTKVEINYAGGVNSAYGALDNFVFTASGGSPMGLPPGTLFGGDQQDDEGSSGTPPEL